MARTTLPIGLVFVAAIGSGTVGGIFYAFSSFVMKALGRIPPEQGIAAMNSINVVVINPSFMFAFIDTVLVCLALAPGSYYWWPQVNGKLVLGAALLYLVGSFAVTMLFNPTAELEIGWHGACAGSGVLADLFGNLDHVESCANGCVARSARVVCLCGPEIGHNAVLANEAICC